MFPAINSYFIKRVEIFIFWPIAMQLTDIFNWLDPLFHCKFMYTLFTLYAFNNCALF